MPQAVTATVRPLRDVLRQFIGHDRSQDYSVSDTRCSYCRREAGPRTEVFVEAVRKWSRQRVCASCFAMIQQRAAAWLDANTSPIYCNDDLIASQFAKRHGRKTTHIVVTESEAHGAAA